MGPDFGKPRNILGEQHVCVWLDVIYNTDLPRSCLVKILVRILKKLSEAAFL